MEMARKPTTGGYSARIRQKGPGQYVLTWSRREQMTNLDLFWVKIIEPAIPMSAGHNWQPMVVHADGKKKRS